MNGQFLRVTVGNAAGAEIQLDDDLLIGRATSGDGSLGGDEELSREHAKVTRAGAELLIEDLGSTNGTYVNGTRVTAATPIRPGDTISLGTTTIEVAGAVPTQPTAEREVAGPMRSTRITPVPGAGSPAAPEAGAGPPPGFKGPPPGFEGPPPGFEGPPPGFEGPPPGFGGPPGQMPAGVGMPAAMKARIKRMAILFALGGLVVGFGLATLVWKVL